MKGVGRIAELLLLCFISTCWAQSKQVQLLKCVVMLFHIQTQHQFLTRPATVLMFLRIAHKVKLARLI